MSWTLNLDDDQRQILDVAQSLLDEHFPIERLQKTDSVDAMAAIAEFGGFALALPEEIDGSGLSAVEEAMVHVLFGRHLVSTGALAAPIAARLCAEAGLVELAKQFGSGAASVSAGIESGGEIIVLDSSASSYALVWGSALSLIDLADAKLDYSDFMGHGRPVGQLTSANAKVLARSASPDLTRIADLLVSAQLLGVAQAALTLAVSYAGLREQFGRPIGSFQAIKHQCADMAVRAELLSAQLDMAAIATRDGRDDADFQVASLRRLAPKAALANARRAIQIHGGIGFSAEANAHHFLKHAHVLRQLGGTRDLMALAAPLAPFERT